MIILIINYNSWQNIDDVLDKHVTEIISGEWSVSTRDIIHGYFLRSHDHLASVFHFLLTIQ